MKLEIFYSVRDGGDGSAYPHFFESAELAELDQDYQNESGDGGFAECCTGTITIESDSPMKVMGSDVTTAEEVLKQMEDSIFSYTGYLERKFPGEWEEKKKHTKLYITKVKALISKNKI